MSIELRAMTQAHCNIQPTLFFKFIENVHTCGHFIWGLLMIGIASDTNQKNPWVESMQEMAEHFKTSQEYEAAPSFLVRWGLSSAPRNVSKCDEFALNTDMNNRF